MSSMAIADAFTSVTRSFPNIRKLMWKELYQLLARLYRNAEWTFMNYGYAPLGPGDPAPALLPEDEPDRSFIQLYYSILHRQSLADRDVLEVGCGRGGGSSYIARYLGPRSVCGVDLSRKAVHFCRQMHESPILRFKVGDSERLPFGDESFDAVVNVESSHCYPSIDRFFSEVKRILRPGGSFHIADLRDDTGVRSFHASLDRSGMRIEEGGDITPNVVSAMISDSARRIRFFRKTLLAPLVHFFQEFAGNEESRIYRKFQERRIHYYGYLLRKA
jgi:SAM-dependent methyltransferase